MRKKSALVIGGAGFIGHHLAKLLTLKNFKVGVLDNLSSGNKKNILKTSYFYHEDILDRNILNNIIKKYDSIFHLAAKVELQESIINPTKTFQNNIVGTSNIVEACIKNKKKLLFASSCSVYPLYEHKRFKENDKTFPSSPYSISKKSSENIINYYSKRGKLNAVILRCFNVYGEKQNSKSTYAAVIPKFIANAKNNNKLKLNNGGKQSRDFVYVNDVCRSYLILNNLKRTGTYNIGSGIPTKIKDLAKIIIKIVGKGKISIGNNLKDDAKFSCANINKIKKIGFKEITKLEDGLKKVIFDE